MARLVTYGGKRLTFKQVAERLGCSPHYVRHYYRKHRTLKGFPFPVKTRGGVNRKPKHNGEGQNLDSLFVAGKVDPDTYYRYLIEYGRTTRHGRGKVAVGKMVGGKLSYRMTEKEDYDYGANYMDYGFMETSLEDVDESADSMLGNPHDYRDAVVRDVEGYRGWKPWCFDSGYFNLPEEHWRAVGTMSPHPSDDTYGDALDGLLGMLEDGE